MKTLLLLACLLLLSVTDTYASHIFGGELLYTHVTGYQYNVTLVMYGDCGAQPSTFGSLYTASPQVTVYDDQTVVATLSLPPDPSSGLEVSAVCPAQIGNTTCNGGTLPGIKKFIYSANVTLTGTSHRWRFVFAGNTNTNVSAGRSSNITNVNNVSSQLVYLEATLDNTAGTNSSPNYTTIPTPFYCINIPQQYNQGAIDPNNDSLVFSLTAALNNGNPVDYVSPYTPDVPLSTTGDFTFSPINGQMSFTPDIVQNSLVVNKVTEYKDGMVVGSSMREMTFIVLPGCNNQPPAGKIGDSSSIIGGINDGHNVINVCAGTPLVSFPVFASDPDTDNVTVTVNNLPATATLNILNNNTTNPQMNFSWNTANVPPGIYTFYATYKDQGCPLSSSQTIAYTIKIANPYTVNASVILPTQCSHKEHFVLNIANGVVPRTVSITQGNSVVKTYTDSTGSITDSLGTGDYIITVSSPNFLCSATTNLSIKDSGLYPEAPLTDTFVPYCLHDTPTQLAATSYPGTAVEWYDTEGNILPTAPTPNTNVPGVYTWYVADKFLVCVSEKITIKVLVNDRPQAVILNAAGPVCLGDKIYLVATGGTTYQWTPEGSFLTDEDGRQYVRILEPVTYTVKVTTQYGCTDAASITYSDVEPCCKFSYPNAFTPNGDGKNDRFRALLHGNMEQYEISIYNRWGQRVYWTRDAYAGWDGTYNGKACEAGTYYFRVEAKCMTGHMEDMADAMELIR